MAIRSATPSGGRSAPSFAEPRTSANSEVTSRSPCGTTRSGWAWSAGSGSAAACRASRAIRRAPISSAASTTFLRPAAASSDLPAAPSATASSARLRSSTSLYPAPAAASTRVRKLAAASAGASPASARRRRELLHLLEATGGREHLRRQRERLPVGRQSRCLLLDLSGDLQGVLRVVEALGNPDPSR